MPPPPTFTDAVEAVRAWVNAQTGLVGAGNPLPLGAHRWLERSPGQGAYALLVYAGGNPDPTEAMVQQARVSATIFAGSDAAARVAAVAYLNTLVAVEQQPPAAITWPDGAATLHIVDQITGPTPLPSSAEYAYLVDAVFHLSPNP